MKKRIIAACIALGIVIAAFIYTRPLTNEKRYPVIDLSQCTLISGYFYDGTGVENERFTISPDDPHFGKLIDLFRSTKFRTRLGNILPRGTKIHPHQDGDYKWEVMFRFENVLFPSGDMGSGDMLHISNFFGDIDLFFDGQQAACSVKKQDEWLNDVMSIITQYPD